MNFCYFQLSGKRGLEIRCNGTGQVISLDIYSGRTGGYGRYNTSSSNLVRRQSSYRQEVQRIRDHHGGPMSAPVVSARALHRRKRLTLGILP